MREKQKQNSLSGECKFTEEEEKARFLREIFQEVKDNNDSFGGQMSFEAKQREEKQMPRQQPPQRQQKTQPVIQGQYREEGRRTLERRKKQKKKKRLKSFLFVLIILLLCIGLCIGAFQFFRSIMMPSDPGIGADLGEEASVTIPQGATTSDIADILKENGLINSTFKFKLESKMNDYDGTYQQGTYTLNQGMTHQQIMEMLQKGGNVDEKYRLVIPEGFTTQKIADRLEEQGIMTAQEFINEANQGTFEYEFLKDLPVSEERKYKLEGYLFPDTYLLYEGVTAHEIIDKMLQRFDEIYTQQMRTAVAESGYTLDEIVTMASIIEAEIQVPEERKIAAGVIRNRLNAGMKLQMDATVLYAQGVTKEDVLYSDLEYDSPYNTYQVDGLPVGPISNPGAAALEAAIYPDENNYMYYVLEAQGSGNHIYTETYEEFLQAKENYKASKE